MCTRTHMHTHTRLLGMLMSTAFGEELLVFFVINCCVLIVVSEALPFTEEEMRLVISSIV